MNKLLTNPTLSLNIRYRFMKAYIYSILLYGSVAWTIGNCSMSRLEVSEMWIMRRMLKISRTDHVSNKTVLKRMNADREIFGIVKTRETSYLGHIFILFYFLLYCLIYINVLAEFSYSCSTTQPGHIHTDNYTTTIPYGIAICRS